MPKPLSRKASRLFVIASIVFVIAATIGSTYYLVSLTSEALEGPDTALVDSARADTSQPDTNRADTTAAPAADSLR